MQQKQQQPAKRKQDDAVMPPTKKNRDDAVMPPTKKNGGEAPYDPLSPPWENCLFPGWQVYEPSSPPYEPPFQPYEQTMSPFINDFPQTGPEPTSGNIRRAHELLKEFLKETGGGILLVGCYGQWTREWMKGIAALLWLSDELAQFLLEMSDNRPPSTKKLEQVIRKTITEHPVWQSPLDVPRTRASFRDAGLRGTGRPQMIEECSRQYCALKQLFEAAGFEFEDILATCFDKPVSPYDE